MRRTGRGTTAGLLFAAIVACASAPVLAQAPKPDSGLPASRDELFGTTPAGSPASSPGKAFSVSGFYGLTAAYTYSDPEHWSRAVNRLQLAAQGELGAGVKWKLGGRVDADPVYILTSDFYLSDVRRDQRTDAFWRETYLDFSALGLEFRVGAQNIVWGEVVGLFFADVVSARDLREFLLPGFDVLRKPQWAARAEYFKGDSHVELVWIPVPTFDDIGKPGSDFYPVRLPSPTSRAAAAPFLEPTRPERKRENSNYGIRANTLVGGWDLGAFYYRSFATSPTFYRLPGPALPVVFQPRYDRIAQVGGTVSKDLGLFVLRAEAVYTEGQRFASTDPLAPQGVLMRDTLDWIVSAEFTLARDVRLNLQGFERAYSDSDRTLAVQTGRFGGSVQLSAKLTASIEPQILWIRTDGGGGLVRPRVNWYPAKNITLAVGMDIFLGPDDGFFGRYDNRDRVYTELRYNF